MATILGNRTYGNIALAAILVFGVALSIIISVFSYSTEEKLIQSQFNEAAENRYFALKRELDSDLAAITSLQTLHCTFERGIERSEFRNFSSHILKRHANILALEWIPRVPDSRREAYERAVRREGFPDFQITERIAQGKMKRAEKRAEYFPTYFVEPYKGNEIALGFDFASDPTRREVLDVARKTGEMLATARISLVQETTNQSGFIVLAPVYRKGALLHSEHSERAIFDELEGFAVGVFRISDIVEQATSYLKTEGIDFILYDASAPEKERFLYTHASRTRKTPLLNKEQPETDLKKTITLEVAGRKWLIIYSATPDFIAARSSRRHWYFLLAGFAFTGLITGFQLRSTRHAEQVEKSAGDLSEANSNLSNEIMEHKKAEAQLQLFSDLTNQSSDGIFVVDPATGRFTNVNDGACWMLRYSRDELLQLSIVDIQTPLRDAVAWQEHVRQLQASGRMFLEFEARPKEGALFPVEVNIRYVVVAGKPYIIAVVRDITERRHIAETLIHSEARFRSLVESTSDWVWEVDENAHYTYVSPKIRDLLGYEPEEVLGKTPFDFMQYQEAKRVADIFGPIVAAHLPLVNLENINLHKDGHLVVLETSGVPFFDSNRNFRGYRGIDRDMSERNRTEESLRESEARHRGILETVQAGIVVIDADTHTIVDINPMVAKMIGETREQILGRACQRYICPAEEGQCPITDLKMTVDNSERVLLKADGTAIPIIKTVAQVTLAGRRRLIESFVDITERKKAAAAAEHSNRQIKSILDCAGEGIFGLDLECNHVFINQMAARLLGYENEDLVGKHSHSTWHHTRPDGTPFPNEECPIHATLNDGKTHYGEEYFWRKDGSGFPVDFSSLPIWENKKIIGAVVTFRDISERKQKEEELQTSEKRYKKLIDSTTSYVYSVKVENGRTISTTHGPGCVATTGYTAEEYAADPYLWNRMILEEDRQPVMEKINALLVGKETLTMEHRIIHKNGTIKWVRDTLVPRYYEGKLVTYDGVVVDITDRKMLENQLRHAQKMEAVGTLAGGVAHDFNNILNVIMGFGAMVMDKLDAGSSSKEYMNEVLIAADKAVNLTKRLLVFSRKQVVDVKPVNINEIISGLQKMLVRIIRENIDFKLELSGRPLMVLADAGQIEQVLMNLAANARDAMPEGGRLTIGAGLKEIDNEYVAAHGYGKTGMYALITVADTGQGMDAETQKKIFEPFFTTKGIGEGTGLGLAISYGIIKQHNGYIKVYSEVGKGTEFKIYLPLLISDLGIQNADLNPKSESQNLKSSKGETILVAEDNASVRKLTRIVLESSGYSVITAEDGDDAITKFMENRDKIALVVLDMIMPKKSGKEVCEEIRKLSPCIKTLFLSGYTMDIIKTQELAGGGFDFLYKPVVSKDLLKKVREILDR